VGSKPFPVPPTMFGQENRGDKAGVLTDARMVKSREFFRELKRLASPAAEVSHRRKQGASKPREHQCTNAI
jgi:hypothetical protein